MEIQLFEEIIMKYFVFLVHAQQSIIISEKEKIEIFDEAKKIANSVFTNVQKYLAGKNEYNLYDKKIILAKAYNDIQLEIEKTIQAYKKDIIINDVNFSYYKIIETLTNSKYNLYLSRNDIEQFLSFNKLTNKTKKEKIENKQLENTNQEKEQEFNDVRKKAFLSMLFGNKNLNPMRYFEVNEYILSKCKKEDIKYLHDPAMSIKEGLYFIETQEERIVKLNYEKRHLGYCVRVIDMDDYFIMYIQGHIKINESKDEFYINEKYPNNQFSKVINAFNLKRTIDLFNELGKKVNQAVEEKSTDIDDFLAGKIL